MHSLPDTSDTWRRIQALRSELVSQLSLRRGPFWAAVAETRARRGIEPEAGVPPTDLDDPARNEETMRLLEAFIPEHLCRTTADVWLRFLEACLLYDPPDDQLVGFAEFITPKFFAALGFEGGLAPVDIPPITKITYPDGTTRLSVIIDKHTSEEGVRRAMRMTRALYGVPDRKSGPFGRDPLLCMELAALYSQRERDPEDPRRWSVTYESLAKEYNMKSARQVEEHIKEGRKLRRNNTRPED